jgi:hypothetical protein
MSPLSPPTEDVIQARSFTPWLSANTLAAQGAMRSTCTRPDVGQMLADLGGERVQVRRRTSGNSQQTPPLNMASPCAARFAISLCDAGKCSLHAARPHDRRVIARMQGHARRSERLKAEERPYALEPSLSPLAKTAC